MSLVCPDIGQRFGRCIRLQTWLHPVSEKLLSHVEALYQFCEQLRGYGVLDDALFRVDIEDAGRSFFEAYFISIRNLPNINESTQLKWQTAFRFVSDVILRLSKSNLPISQLQQIKCGWSNFKFFTHNFESAKSEPRTSFGPCRQAL